MQNDQRHHAPLQHAVVKHLRRRGRELHGFWAYQWQSVVLRMQCLEQTAEKAETVILLPGG